MVEEKTVSVSLRVTPRFKRLLKAAAEREHRSQTNLLETLLFAHCVKYGVEEDAGEIPSRVEQGNNE